MSLKFDGKKLKDGGKTLANVNGDRIREGNGTKTLLNVRDDKIREGNGTKTLFNLKKNDIREGSGTRKIADMDDVKDDIDGPGGVMLAALWVLFCR